MTSIPFEPVLGGIAAGALTLGAAAYATFTPRAGWWTPVIWRGDRTGPARIALTFDDGPSPEWTPAVLDSLGELGVLAAFFVIGSNANRHPALLRRIDEEGHLIGNHSFDHDHFGVFRRVKYWRAQLARTDQVICTETGLLPRYFRPPMGFKTPHLARAARQSGQHLVAWTRRTLDGLPTSEAEILRRLIGPTCAGDIIALHDGLEPRGSRRPDATVRALGPLVRALRDRGMSPVRLDEIVVPRPYAPASPAMGRRPESN